MSPDRTSPPEPVSLPLRIDPASPIPPFEQIRAQVSLQVASGRLRPGARLPTIRDLAGHIGVAPNTVARAYRELEASGILAARGRAGTFVADEPTVAFAVVERTERLTEAARRYAIDVLHLGVDPSEALEAAAVALRVLRDQQTTDT